MSRFIGMRIVANSSKPSLFAAGVFATTGAYELATEPLWAAFSVFTALTCLVEVRNKAVGV